VLTEVLAKLLGMVVVLWATLLSGGPLAGRSPMKQLSHRAAFRLRLLDRLRDLAALGGVLGRLQRELAGLAPQARRRKQPSTRQLLHGSKPFR